MISEGLPVDQAGAMDRMYRYTRHVYDLTRKYYLLGRDRLLASMELPEGASVLEVGCGTARNLVKLQRWAPHARLFGLDASAEMLRTGERTLQRAGLGNRIVLRQGLAEQLDHAAMFGQDRPFDAVFFSYSLSMIPTWQDAIQAAMRNLRSGGCMYVVDFGDQAELPAWFARMLKRWLACFHVYHRPELLEYLRGLPADIAREVQVTWILRRYAYLAKVVKA